jgi:hypothetical protein
MKMVKMSEVSHKCLDSLDDNNESSSKTATLVTCIIEYCNMTQALYYQDDSDNKLKLQNILYANTNRNKTQLTTRVATTDSKGNF